MHRPVTLTLHPRRVARPARTAGALVAAAALTLGACSTQSPAQTTAPYLPADGVPANVGAVQARDLLVLSPSKGATGVLSGSLINSGSTPVSVTFLTVADVQGGTRTGPTIQLAPLQQQRILGVQFPDLDASPGALTGIVLRTSAGEQNVSVPVLLPDGVYATITATPLASPAGSTTGPATLPPSATTGPAATAAPTSTGSTSAATSATPVPPTSPTG